MKNWLRKAFSLYRMNAVAANETHEQHLDGGGGDVASTTSSARSSRFHFASVGKQQMKRWEADYVLEELDRLHLFDEYIEMGQC